MSVFTHLQLCVWVSCCNAEHCACCSAFRDHWYARRNFFVWLAYTVDIKNNKRKVSVASLRIRQRTQRDEWNVNNEKDEHTREADI
jgi:hypothetical protein